MRGIKSLKNQRGFTLIELLIGLAVIISTLGLVGHYLSSYADNLANQSAADHQRIVSDAAAKYIKDNYAAILSVSGPTAPATIIVPMLKDAGYLPASFANQNLFGQDYKVLVLRPTESTLLETLVITTGGETISELNIRRIAQLVGARGGFISSVDTTKAQGSYGGWQVELSSYGVSPEPGHLAVALFFDDGALVSDYLYRNKVEGRPELNQMNTAINMAGNDINNGGWFRTKGDGGWYSQKWDGGWYMSDPDWVRSYANKNVYTGGQMKAGSIHSDGRLSTGEYVQIGGIAQENTACSPNGLIGRDSSGVLLSCQSGRWGKLSNPKGRWQEMPGSGIVPVDGFLRVKVGASGAVHYRVYINGQEVSNDDWNPAGWGWAEHTSFIPVAAGSCYQVTGNLQSLSVWWMPG